MKTYTYDESLQSSTEYFNNDLSPRAFVDKYALRNELNEMVELTPSDMHRRLAREIARVEKGKFKKPLTEDEIFEHLDGFKSIIPQGSPMYAIGNFFQYVSLSNCYVINSPRDSLGSIFKADQEMAQIFKRRGGNGVDISNLRPVGSSTKNSSRTSTGTPSWMERYSNTTREIGQCLEKNQLVLTEKGLKPISDVRKGEKVWTKEGWIKVVRLHNNPKKNLYRLTTVAGYSVVASMDHVVQTYIDNKRQETTISELEADDNVVLSICTDLEETWGPSLSDRTELEIPNYKNSNRKPSNCELTNFLSKELAYILGYSYGDGYVELGVNKNPVLLDLACSNDYPKIKTKLSEYCKKVFSYNINTRKGDGDLERLSINNATIMNFLQHNGLLKQKSGEIQFPDKILYANKRIQAAFISGYFDADGYASGSKSGYSFSSIRKDFLEKVQTVLSTQGILSKIHSESRSHLGWSDIYKLCIVGKCSQEQMVKLYSESIKISDSGFSSLRDNWKTPFTYKDFNIKQGNYNYCPSDGSLSLNCVNRLLKDGEKHVCNNLVLDKVKNIEFVKKEETFDLELESEHMFWCEGIYVHNSGRRAASMITMSVHHPDIETFISIKEDSTKVTGANISVRLSDEFLNALQKNEDYEQRFPIDSETPEISKMVSAKDIWDKMIKSSHRSAEPGLLMWDNIIKESPSDCYDDYKSVSTNPCCFSEQEEVIVSTKEGPKPLTSITKNDEIWIPHNVRQILGNKNEYAKTSGYFKVGEQSIYKVTLNNEEVLYITNNHKLARGEDNWKKYDLVELKDLSVGDKILTTQNNKMVSIKAIEYSGEYQAGCIEVENIRVFSANGILSGNSEIPLCPYDSCRLLAINLFHAVKNPFTKESEYDFDKLYETTIIGQRLMDDIVDLELEAINRIIKKIKSDPETKEEKEIELNLWKNVLEKARDGRRTGTGITALGDCMASLGIKYGSEKSIEFTDKIYKTLKLAAYRSSVDMAKELGAFPVWDHNKEKKNPFLLRIKEDDPKLYSDMKKYGRRNIAILTTAPTGTVSMMAKLEDGRHGTTSGIEPLFKTHYVRRKKGNPGDNDFRTDFVDQSGDNWMEFEVYHPGVKMWMDINNKKDLKGCPYVEADNINWVNRVKLQAAAQRHIDHAISSTINLPNSATEAEVSKIYLQSWKSGLKGITVYRDGCRTGVLVSADEKKKEDKSEIVTTNSHKRPKKLPCDVYHVKVKGEEYFVLVGLWEDGSPYEIFAGKNGVVDKKVKKGTITKLARGKYKAEFDDGKELPHISNFTTDEQDTFTRLVSASLRHGVPISFILSQAEKSKGSLQSFSKSIIRSLKKYVPDGTEVHGQECPECESKLTRESGCVLCRNCGFSLC